MDINSLAHTKWNCKYHIVFAPKYRRKIIYGQLKRDIANILSMLCKRKNAKKIQEYIQNQLKEDLEYDQMTLKEYIDPFTGEPVKTNR